MSGKREKESCYTFHFLSPSMVLSQPANLWVLIVWIWHYCITNYVMNDCKFFLLDCKLPWTGTTVLLYFCTTSCPIFGSEVCGWLHPSSNKGRATTYHALPGKPSSNRLPVNCGLGIIVLSSLVYLTYSTFVA